jgi:uncharacterized protein
LSCNQADKYIAVIRALASKWKGMDRNEIIEKTKMESGGGMTNMLEELEQSGFITSYYTFGKKQKEIIYRLTDPYSLFYLHFIETDTQGTGVWLQLSASQKYKSWTGYAFENLALCHIPQIKKAMGISGVYAAASTFYQKGTLDRNGAQIDLILDRNDHVINLFELKFYDEVFTPNQAFADNLRDKKSIFKVTTGANKQLS